MYVLHDIRGQINSFFPIWIRDTIRQSHFITLLSPFLCLLHTTTTMTTTIVTTTTATTTTNSSTVLVATAAITTVVISDGMMWVWVVISDGMVGVWVGSSGGDVRAAYIWLDALRLKAGREGVGRDGGRAKWMHVYSMLWLHIFAVGCSCASLCIM